MLRGRDARRTAALRARHVEPSVIASLDDEPAQPSERLLDLAERVIPAARRVSMGTVSDRIASGPKWPEVWPGEHYKLLAALVEVTGASRVVEIGTYLGLGSLALLHRLPPDGRLATFDLAPYTTFEGHCLRTTDFVDGRLAQIVADLTTDAAFEAHRDVLRDADLV